MEKFWFLHVKNGCRGGKGIKKRTLKVHPQGLESEGSLYFDFKAKKKKENRRVVCFSGNKRSTLKGESSKGKILTN